MANATSSVTPHMLVRWQQPRSPMDSWCDTLKEGETNSNEEYLSSLKSKQKTYAKSHGRMSIEISKECG